MSIFLKILIAIILTVSPFITEAQIDFKDEFAAICDTVEKHFYQPEKIQKIFSELKERYAPKLEAVNDNHVFSKVVNEMLSELKTSHTHYYTRDDFAFYQLADIFYPLPWIKALFEADSVAYPSLGMLTKVIDNKRFVTGVLNGGPAEDAGILKGDEIIGFEEIEWGRLDELEEWVGKTLNLKIRREENGKVLKIPIEPKLRNPQNEFLAAIQNSIYVEDVEGIKVGYIHMWSYAGKIFQEELEASISWGKLSDADVLIWDLRDGWGGASPQYLNIFNKNIPLLSFKTREGNTRYFDSQWRKPVVMLTNEGSRSGKELLAFGFKKYKLGPIVGERTAGAVVAGRLFVTPGKNLLYLAVNNAIIDGEVLEGKGVEPTIKIPMKIPYLKGRDIQLERAVQEAIILTQKQKK